MSSNIACVTCGGRRFEKRSGAFYCLQCRTRSEEHGQETEIDAASIGVFSSDVASTLKTKRLKTGRDRRRGLGGSKNDRRPCPAAFTHVDAFSFCVRAWVDEAVQLGADQHLQEIAFCLWARYLGAVNEAFVPFGKEPTLSVRPSNRDLQVALYSRRKILSGKRIANIRKGLTEPEKKKPRGDRDALATDDESRSARRMRRKKRMSFLKTLSANASSSSSSSDSAADSDSSLASFATYASNSSNVSNLTGDFDDFDDFGFGAHDHQDELELSSSRPSSGLSGPSFGLDETSSGSHRRETPSIRNSFDHNTSEWDSLLEDSRAAAHLSSAAAVGAATTAPSSSGGGGGEVNVTSNAVSSSISAETVEMLRREAEREAAAEHDHAGVLSRMTRNKANVWTDQVRRVTLRRAFAVFCLAVLCTDNNRICLSDLIRWTRTGAVSYHTAVKNIPSAMQLRSIEDFGRFAVAEIAPDRVKDVIYRMGCLMDLKEVNFNAFGTLYKVMKRFVREFSLPLNLPRIIRSSVSDATDLLEVVQEFPEGGATPGHGHCFDVNAVDVRALALLLFALKYLYGLDGVSENFISASARKRNNENQDRSRTKFVFCDWMELSRRRLFLMAKHCPEMRDVFFPGDGIEASLALLGTSEPPPMTHRAELAAVARESNMVKERNTMPKASASRLDNESKTSLKDLTSAMSQLFGGPDWPREGETPDVAESLTPMRHFAKHFTDNETIPEEMSQEDVEALRKLVEMGKSRVMMQSPDGDHAEEIDLSITFRSGHLPTPHGPVGDLFKEFPYLDERVQRPQEGKFYSVNKTYWRTRPRRYRLSTPQRMLGPEKMMALYNSLPDNFLWVLEYFSRYAFVAPFRLLMELVFIEETIVKTDPSFFGEIEANSAKTVQTQRSRRMAFREMLKKRSKMGKLRKKVRKRVSDEESLSEDEEEEEMEDGDED